MVFNNDEQFYSDCCTGAAPHCDLFFQRRPIGTCDGYSPPACCGECASLHKKSLHANDTALL